MQQRTAQLLVQAGKELELSVKLHANYSGRGMFGRTTSGVVVDNLSEFLQCVAYAAGRLDDRNDEMIDDFSNVRVDNMGKSTIYY